MKVLVGTCLSGKSTLAELMSKGKRLFDIDSLYLSNDMEYGLNDVRDCIHANQYNLDVAVIHGITVSNRIYLLGGLNVPIDIVFCRTSLKTAMIRNSFRLHNQIPIDVIKHQFSNLQDIDHGLEKYHSIRYIVTK